MIDDTLSFAEAVRARRSIRAFQSTPVPDALICEVLADARRRAGAANFSFFNAPHVALLFQPDIGDGVRVAGDLGMYAQTFLLSLAARGLGGVPQTVLGLYADTTRKTLGIPDTLRLLFGISFGFPDETAAANSLRMDRDDLGVSVKYHS